jgi:hypothetical protein
VVKDCINKCTIGELMLHFIYKITSSSGKYYIGRHSTNDANDNYMGSGKWIRSLKDKSSITREILSFHDTFDELKEAERAAILENIGKDGCMNFNNNPVGFASGDMNPARSKEGRERASKRVSGDGNPSKRPDVRKKMSESQKGRPGRKGIPQTEQAKKNMSAGRLGIKYSEEGRKKLSESRKRQHAAGERVMPSFEGKTHTEETKSKQSEKAKNRPIVVCPHCGVSGQENTMKRWHFDKCRHKIISCEQNGF